METFALIYFKIGLIGLSIFRWSPTYDVAAILTSIQSLLPDPNTSSPANGQAAQLYQSNRAEYNQKVMETVEQSWLDDI